MTAVRINPKQEHLFVSQYIIPHLHLQDVFLAKKQGSTVEAALSLPGGLQDSPAFRMYFLFVFSDDDCLQYSLIFSGGQCRLTGAGPGYGS